MNLPTSPPATALVTTRPVEVSWGDCDAAGVVFYPRYYAWFDTCTHTLLSSVGLDHHTLRGTLDLVGTPLVHAAADFRSSATFGDLLTATSWIDRVGGTSFTVRHVFRLGERVVVVGEEIRVWARASAERPGGIEAVDPGEEIRGRLQGG